jgi:phospholipase/lecithinase/hemolysin
MGNPRYPGYTSANGPNWVGSLTTQHNASILQTYNLAYGGATVDSALVKPYKPEVLSVKQQVLDLFLPGYTGAEPTAASPPKWKSGDTLFAVWIGINDVGNSFWDGEEASAALYEKIFTVYADLLGKLYEAGARNFLFINVPPVDRSPLTIGQGKTAQDLEKKAIETWNTKLGSTVRTSLTGQGKAANVWMVDSNAIFTKVLDNPASFEATKGYKNVTGFCDAYQKYVPLFENGCR